MDESLEASPVTASPLKAAREARGLSLDTLAAQLKVPPSRLAALEEGRWADLPDGPYVRALAKTVCRSLQLDEAPVLRALPGVSASSLEHVNSGLNQPFHDPRSVSAPLWRSPWAWAAVAVLFVGLGLSWWLPPSDKLTESTQPGEPSASSAPSTAVPEPTPSVDVVPASASPLGLPAVVEPVSVPASAMPTASEAADPAAPAVAQSLAQPSGEAAPASEVPLRVRARQAAWVSVVDGRGQSVLSRLLQAGEAVELMAAAPLRVTLGNAPDTELVWRGQAVDVSANAQQRVARLELR